MGGPVKKTTLYVQYTYSLFLFICLLKIVISWYPSPIKAPWSLNSTCAMYFDEYLWLNKTLTFCRFWRQKQCNCTHANIQHTCGAPIEQDGVTMLQCYNTARAGLTCVSGSQPACLVPAYLRYQLKGVSQTRGVFSQRAQIKKGFHLFEWNQENIQFFA